MSLSSSKRPAPPWPEHALSNLSGSAAADHCAVQREASRDRIVDAYRRQLLGLCGGPTDEELKTFARMAVAEMKARRVGERPQDLAQGR